MTLVRKLGKPASVEASKWPVDAYGGLTVGAVVMDLLQSAHEEGDQAAACDAAVWQRDTTTA